MNRPPESKVAAQLIEEYLKKHNITLKHSHVLEIIAIDRGFANHNVMQAHDKKSLRTHKKKTSLPPVEKTTHERLKETYDEWAKSQEPLHRLKDIQNIQFDKAPPANRYIPGMVLQIDSVLKEYHANMEDSATWQSVSDFLTTVFERTGENRYKIWSEQAHALAYAGYLGSNIDENPSPTRYIDEEEDSIRRIVHTLTHEPSDEAKAFYDSLLQKRGVGEPEPVKKPSVYNNFQRVPELSAKKLPDSKTLFKNLLTGEYAWGRINGVAGDMQVNQDNLQKLIAGKHHVDDIIIEFHYPHPWPDAHVSNGLKPGIIPVIAEVMQHIFYLDYGQWYIPSVGCIQFNNQTHELTSKKLAAQWLDTGSVQSGKTFSVWVNLEEKETHLTDFQAAMERTVELANDTICGGYAETREE